MLPTTDLQVKLIHHKTLEKYITETLGIVVEIEKNSHYLLEEDIGPGNHDTDWAYIEDMLTSGRQSDYLSAKDVLNYLCSLGKLEPGNYLVDMDD